MEANRAIENQKSKKEIARLDNRARELEDWLFENTESKDFFKVLHEYNDVLFKLTTKKELNFNREHGFYEPQTFSMPRFINKSENFKR